LLTRAARLGPAMGTEFAMNLKGDLSLTGERDGRMVLFNDSVKKTCIHIVHPDGRLIPFDRYNLFYRDHLEQARLAPLRLVSAGKGSHL